MATQFTRPHRPTLTMATPGTTQQDEQTTKQALLPNINK